MKGGKDAKDEEEAKHHQDLQVGFREGDPRMVEHQYKFDRIFREWHCAETPFLSIKKGNACVTLLSSWIISDEFKDQFSDEERKEGKRIRKGAVISLKVEVELRAMGKTDEHYYASYDGVPMVFRGTEHDSSMRHLETQGFMVKSDIHVEAISDLMAICYNAGLLKLDYTVGKTVKDEVKAGMRRRSP